MQAAQYLPEDYVTEKILNLLGDGDRVEEILEEKDMDDQDRMTGGEDEGGDEEGALNDLLSQLDEKEEKE